MIAEYDLLNSQSLSTFYRRASFFVLALVAMFHFPVIWIGNDSIGLFDIILILGYLAVFVLHAMGQQLHFDEKWNEYLLLTLLYGGYILVNLLLNTDRDAKPVLLAVKYFENSFFFFIVLIIYFETNSMDVEFTARIVQASLLIMVMYLLYTYFYGSSIVQDGQIARIGLPFMTGTAANPAGFILGMGVLLHLSVFFRLKKYKLFTTVSFVLTIVALLFTVSRTNVFALLLVIIVYLLTKIVRDRRALIVASVVIVVTFVGFSVLSTHFASRTGKISTFIEILKNPSVIFLDPSFRIRYTIAWPLAYDQWMTNVGTFLFGNGLGKNSVVDGTFIRLLANQGLIGFLLFCYIWLGFFLQKFGRYKWLRIILLFVVINGLTGDTLVVSYRTVQIYILLVITLVYSLEFLEKREISSVK